MAARARARLRDVLQREATALWESCPATALPVRDLGGARSVRDRLFALSGWHPTGSVVISALYVVACVAAAWRIGGPVAAALAALLVGLSLAKTSASLVLSDALGALLMVLMLIAFTSCRLAAAAFAGLLAGAAVCVRLLSVFVLPAVAAATRGRPGRRRRCRDPADRAPGDLPVAYLRPSVADRLWLLGNRPTAVSISSVYVTHATFPAASVFGARPPKGRSSTPTTAPTGHCSTGSARRLVGHRPMLVNGGPTTKLANARVLPKRVALAVLGIRAAALSRARLGSGK